MAGARSRGHSSGANAHPTTGGAAARGAPLSRALVIVGTGRFGMEAAWIAEDVNAVGRQDYRWDILGYADDDPCKIGMKNYEHSVMGRPEAVRSRFPDQEIWYICALGDREARARMVDRLVGLRWRPATLIHPSVICAKGAQVGQGSYVGALSVISPKSVIGNHVLISQRVTIGHESAVDDFSTICQGAQVDGLCALGQGVSMGANASIHAGCFVGQHAIIGPNSVVIKSVPPNTHVMGIPARPITTHS